MFQTIYKKALRLVLSSAIVLSVSLLFAHTTLAATLFVAPSSSKASIGNIVSVKVLVNTDGKSINNAETTVQFPTDLLEVVSVSKTSSIFSLWVEEPKYSNINGTVTLNGGIPNPGYTGQGGEIISVLFKAKKQGNATIVLANSAIRQNDGLGTDILTSQSPGTVEIKAAEVVQDVPEPTTVGTPLAPVVSSATHPDQKAWYNVNTVDLRWAVPDSIIAVSTSVTHSLGVPTAVFDQPISSRKLSNLDDGAWYFNVRFKNKNGWGATAHYKVQIDTVPPVAFKIAFPHGSVTDDPRPIVYFNTTDKTSGIQYYEVKIGEGEFNRVSIDTVSSNPYAPGLQEPGTHQIFVKAVDFAQNETVQSNEFTVTPINTPVITDYSNELSEGDLLRVRGTSYPLTSVEVVVEDAVGRKVSQITNVQIDGNFSMIWSKNLQTGSYTISARAIDKREAKSEFSKPLALTVNRSALVSLSGLILNWLSIIIILILLIGGCILLITFFINKNVKIKKSIRRDIKNAESSIHKAFDSLRENVREQIKLLEKTRSKRELTSEEEKIVRRLQENLSKSEALIAKEIGDIEDDL